MLKFLQGFCLIILYVWVVDVIAESQPELQISLTTLKSDLNVILEDHNNPRTVDIEYAPYAVLHVIVVPKHDGSGGRYIKIDGTVKIKQKKTPVVERSDLVYYDGSFGRSLSEEDTTYIIMKPNPGILTHPAEKKLNYVVLTALKNRLNTAIKTFGWPNIITEIRWPAFDVGSGFTSLTYSPENDRVLFHQPLKGIALHRGDSVKNLVKPRTYKTMKDWIKPSNRRSGLLSGLSQLVATKQPDALLSGFSRIFATRHPDMFFDVWYEPRTGRLGSSSGSLDGIDAVRVYDESEQNIALTAAPTVDTSVPAGGGERIRQSTFEKDMYDAYTELFNPSKGYINAIINYADEIVLEVRPGGGENHFVTATGTTNADAFGRGPYNVRAYYNINKVEYSGAVTGGETFVPITYDQKSWYLKYLDWGMFERHLRAIWAAMEGGCNQRGRLFYDYRIYYGGSILVTYDCKARSLALRDIISVLTHGPSFRHGSVTQCSSLRFLPTQQLEMPCINTGVPPIAIRQEAKELWIKYEEPISISTAVLRRDMVTLQEALFKNARSRTNALTRGAIVLDEYVLLVMKLPQGENLPVEVYPHGTEHKMLKFHEGEFWTTTGAVVHLKDVSTRLKYEITGSRVAEEYVIGAKYVTIKKLQQDLNSVSKEALSRCTSRKLKYFSFMLVHHRRFALHGYYDCSEKVFLIEGDIRAFITDRYGGTEIRMPSRIILNFVYVQSDKIFIADGNAFDEVYAISVPETNLEAEKESYGAPIHLDQHTFILFKSRE